jgi:hypothetical protein
MPSKLGHNRDQRLRAVAEAIAKARWLREGDGPFAFVAPFLFDEAKAAIEADDAVESPEYCPNCRCKHCLDIYWAKREQWEADQRAAGLWIDDD